MFFGRYVDDPESAKRSEQGHVLLQVSLKSGCCDHSLIDVAKGDHRLPGGGRKVDWKLVDEVPIGRGFSLAGTIDFRWKAIDFDAKLTREIANFLIFGSEIPVLLVREDIVESHQFGLHSKRRALAPVAVIGLADCAVEGPGTEMVDNCFLTGPVYFSVLI
jgi:hypothetical protein